MLHDFYKVFWKKKQMGGERFMHVHANVHNVAVSESIQLLDL
jgi:hypothetical protein